MGTSPDIDDLMPAELKKLLVKPLARNAEQQQPKMKLLEENAEQKRVVAACCPPGAGHKGTAERVDTQSQFQDCAPLAVVR